MTVYRQRLVESMAKNDMDVKKLAEESGVSKTNIYAVLERDVIPKAQTLAALADALGVSMDWLWGRVD